MLLQYDKKSGYGGYGGYGGYVWEMAEDVVYLMCVDRRYHLRRVFFSLYSIPLEQHDSRALDRRLYLLQDYQVRLLYEQQSSCQRL